MKKLDAKSLMVGDYVFNSQGEKCKVWLISQMFDTSQIELDNLDKPNDGCFEMEAEVQPIPLAPEILEKNGFKWDYYHNSLKLVVGTIYMSWGFYINCLSCYDLSNEGNCNIVSLKCIYVHQLQHALRLCGIEKEINL